MTAVDERGAAGMGADGSADGSADGAEAPSDDRSRPKVARYVALAVGLVLALFIALLATRPQDQGDSPSAALVGKRVPALAGATLAGGKADVDSFRGKWVLVNFVAEWCIACQVEHPDLKAFAEANAKDVQVVAVAFQSHDLDKLRAFFAKNGGNWPVITNDDGRAAFDFGVTAVPETFLVNPNGVVFAHAEGVTREWLDGTYGPAKAAWDAAQQTRPSSQQSTPSSSPP